MLSITILAVAALGFTLMGFGALVSPTVVTRQFGIPELTEDGRSEVRAVYGGFGLVVAGLLIVAIVNDELRSGIALTVGVALLGMAAGRVISAIVDRSLSRVATLYLVIEAVAGGLLLAAR